MLKLGIVGAGGMAGARAAGFAGLDGVAVTAVYSRRAELAGKLAARVGATVHTELSAFLDAVDAVVVAVPNHLHAELAEAALAAGRHVLVEYPLCTGPEQAPGLLAAARTADRVLMVGNTIVHEAMFGYLRERVERLGTLLSAASRVSFHGAAPDVWYLSAERVGPVFAALHYHHVEYARALLGEVTAVTARDDAPGAGQVGGTMVMAHAGGATSCVQWYLTAGPGGEPRGYWLTGSLGAVTVVSRESGRSLAVWDGAERVVETFDDQWGVAGSCADFVRAVRGELDHTARLRSDLRTLQVGFEASLAASTGAWRSIPAPLRSAL